MASPSSRFPMPSARPPRPGLSMGLPWLLAAVLGPVPGSMMANETARPAGVTVYRCTDSRGQLLALRDSPCKAGERQEVLQMQRPQDPPPRAATTTPVVATAAPAAPAREVRVVTVQPPQPLYECTDGEGASYLSDSDEGNPRWVPFWTTGYPVVVSRAPHPPAHPPVVRPPGVGPGPGPRPPRPPRPPLTGPEVIVPGGTWVRDSCLRLPQDQACTRLSDRRYEILRLYHAGMPSERQALDREQALLDARMGNDCPGY